MECGECTACCKLLKVDELNKPAGTECIYCTSRCTIYEERPQSCRDLSCAYHQVKHASVKMRPDNCGVVFEKIADDLMFGTVDPKHKDFSFIRGQISYFLKEGINTVLSKNGQPIVYHLDDVSPETLLQRIHEMVKA